MIVSRVIMFQFHKVQLKVYISKVEKIRRRLFQFHKVQLKENQNIIQTTDLNVSIP